MIEGRSQTVIPEHRRDLIVPALVALATLIVFSGALRNGFLNWDDETNILTNPCYRGLGWANLRWMFTTMLLGHYQPLAWLTFALDYLVWGMNPFGYHLTNILLHAANAALFYKVALCFASRPTVGPSADRSLSPGILAALAAILFSVHPLRVESVAWVTERKDVLSAFFYLWAVYAYLRQHLAGRPSGMGWKITCWVAFALALLAKSMVITLPAVLIILDFYPLRRLPGDVRQWFGASHRRVWLEKLPFLVPALIIAMVEYSGERRLGAILTETAAAHCARAALGLTFYFWKTFWPVNLCPLYESPIPFDPFAWPFLVSGAVVGIIVLGLILSYRRWPAGSAAWACYVVTLAPVLGVVSFGSQLVADRYSYLACLPWAILTAAGFGWAWQRARAWSRGFLCLGLGLVLAGLIGSTWRQVGVWHDSETLWKYTIALRPRTSLAHNDLGVALAGQGRLEEAVAHYREALRIVPDYADAHYNFGNALAAEGRLDEAIAHYREAVRISPARTETHNNLGGALAGLGRWDEAVVQYREALRIVPDYAEAHNNLGMALAGQGRLDEAVLHYREALRLQPDYFEADNNLGNALFGQGRAEEAAAHYREALRLKPDYAQAHNNLGSILAGQGQADEAVAHYREALRLAPDYWEACYNLGRVLAKQGKVDEARREFREALRINPGLEPARKNLDSLRNMNGRP